MVVFFSDCLGGTFIENQNDRNKEIARSLILYTYKLEHKKGVNT